jgi:hydrogenase nickel incorporation protein HypA/HybF
LGSGRIAANKRDYEPDKPNKPLNPFALKAPYGISHITIVTRTDAMHEMGIALEIVEIVQASIPADQARARVARVNLKIGKLSALVPDSLRFCFEVAARDSRVAGAELVIEEVPVTACCRTCNHHWTLVEPVFVCPTCRGTAIQMLTGREMDIETIELLEEDPPHADHG